MNRFLQYKILPIVLFALGGVIYLRAIPNERIRLIMGVVLLIIFFAIFVFREFVDYLERKGYIPKHEDDEEEVK
jgi:hypothetical protein